MWVTEVGVWAITHSRLSRVSYNGITQGVQPWNGSSNLSARFSYSILENNVMSNFFGMISKIFYILAILSIFYSVYTYQSDATLGIFIGLWVPTLLLLGPTCPWSNKEWVVNMVPAKVTNTGR